MSDDNNSFPSKETQQMKKKKPIIIIACVAVVALFAYFLATPDSPSTVVKKLHTAIDKMRSLDESVVWNSECEDYCIPGMKYYEGARLMDKGKIYECSHTIDGNTLPFTSFLKTETL